MSVGPEAWPVSQGGRGKRCVDGQAFDLSLTIADAKNGLATDGLGHGGMLQRELVHCRGDNI